jgi:hypothetical protein
MALKQLMQAYQAGWRAVKEVQREKRLVSSLKQLLMWWSEKNDDSRP